MTLAACALECLVGITFVFGGLLQIKCNVPLQRTTTMALLTGLSGLALIFGGQFLFAVGLDGLSGEKP